MDRKFNVGTRQYRVVPPAERKASFRGEGFGWITVDGETRGVEVLESGAHHVDIVVDGTRHVVYLARDESGDGWWVSAGGRARHIVEETADGRRSRSGGRGGAVGRKLVTPSFPATVVNVMVAEGDEVTRGQPLVVVSAMKMEMTLTAPYAGVVASVSAEQGATVAPGDELVVITAVDGDDADEQ